MGCIRHRRKRISFDIWRDNPWKGVEGVIGVHLPSLSVWSVTLPLRHTSPLIQSISLRLLVSQYTPFPEGREEGMEDGRTHHSIIHKGLFYFLDIL